jgi:pyruvate dehydrogenase E2 component (dihydrolipoamide acetyltransferase)
MSEFRMPSLGADMEAGTLVEWLVKPGAAVKRGDIVAVVETQKGAIEIEVFEDGVLEEHLAAAGAVLPVGTPMARIRGGAEAPAAITESKPTPPTPPPKPGVSRERAPPSPLAQPSALVRASPAARRLAEELRIDLSAVAGSGPGGAITRADIVARAPPSVKKTCGYDFSAMRKAIAAAMARSKREIPHYYLSHTIDIGAAQAWLAGENAQRAPADRILMGALLVKASALAARAFPELNGFYVDNEFRPSPVVHAGVAIAIRGVGLAAPAIHDATDLNLATLMSKMRDLVGRVRAGRFRSSEIADPTITITSLGDRGVEAVWGVIYPPQVAIVGFGRIVTRPWMVDNAITPRPTVCVTLAADHRVSDGHRGALFLEKVEQLLNEPAKL